MSFFWHVTHNRIFTDMDEHLRKCYAMLWILFSGFAGLFTVYLYLIFLY